MIAIFEPDGSNFPVFGSKSLSLNWTGTKFLKKCLKVAFLFKRYNLTDSGVL